MQMIMKQSLFDMQVCVPKTTTDEQVLEFAESNNPCGTLGGWTIRRQGSENLGGCDERVQCETHENNCHIMLDV